MDRVLDRVPATNCCHTVYLLVDGFMNNVTFTHKKMIEGLILEEPYMGINILSGQVVTTKEVS